MGDDPKNRTRPPGKKIMNPEKRKLEKRTHMVVGGNSLTAANIKTDILNSNLCNIYIKMGLTGRDIRLDDKGNQQDVGELEQPERMKIMKTLVDKVLPASKEEVADESSHDKWIGILADAKKEIGVEK